MKEFKINNEKVLLFKDSGIRIKVGKNKSMPFDHLKAAIETYLYIIKLADTQVLDVNEEMLKDAINPKVCGISITIDLAFEIYNEIVKRFDLDLNPYSKLRYDKKKSLKICPV